MNRSVRAIAALAALVVLTTGCSVREVQVWFALRGNPSVPATTARSLADKVNAGKPAGCDGFYPGGCVPDNQAVVHCAGTFGEGPTVLGPIPVKWDHFGLDPDGNKVACDALDPTGALDLVTTQRGAISVAGWAMDGDTSGAIAVHIWDNGVRRVLSASGARPDVGLLGLGPNHGFSDTWAVADGTHQVCAFAISTGGGSNAQLGCRTVEVARPYDGSTLDRPLPVFSNHRIGGQFTLQVEDWTPTIVQHDSTFIGFGTVRPDPGEVFVEINTSLYCGEGSELPCTSPGDVHDVRLTLVDSNGVEYPYSSKPQAVPDLLATGRQSTQTNGTPRTWGYATFSIPATATGQLILKASATGTSPTYFHVGVCPNWCGGSAL